MYKATSFIHAATVSVFIFMLSACSNANTVEGTYTISEGPAGKGVIVTLGKESFVFSSGANGTYEVSGDNVIFSGTTFTGSMKIRGSDLVNEKWHFSKNE